MSPTIQARVFECAAHLLGGHRQLAVHLGVPHWQVLRWMANQEVSSLSAFLEAVDIILASKHGFAAIFTSPGVQRSTALH